MEFPAVSHTRVEFWQERHYTRWGMWLLTLFFGFFGFHHLMLKSPQTALLVVLGNFFFLGLPWLYDLVQLFPWWGLGLDDRELNTYGLDHPFGPLGLAKGMWKPTDKFIDASPYKDNTTSFTPYYYMLYCLFIWCPPLASMFAGDFKSIIIRVFQFSTVAGYEIFCIIFDIITLFIMPGTLIYGIKRPWLFANQYLDMIIYPGLSFSSDGYSEYIMPTYISQNLKEYGEKLEKYNLYVEKQEQERIKAGKQQSGGGDNSSDKQEGGGKTLFDYFSFTTIVAIIAGGLVLSAVRKTNGLSSDKNDSPPNPRGI